MENTPRRNISFAPPPRRKTVEVASQDVDLIEEALLTKLERYYSPRPCLLNPAVPIPVEKLSHSQIWFCLRKLQYVAKISASREREVESIPVLSDRVKQWTT